MPIKTRGKEALHKSQMISSGEEIFTTQHWRSRLVAIKTPPPRWASVRSLRNISKLVKDGSISESRTDEFSHVSVRRMTLQEDELAREHRGSRLGRMLRIFVNMNDSSEFRIWPGLLGFSNDCYELCSTTICAAWSYTYVFLLHVSLSYRSLKGLFCALPNSTRCLRASLVLADKSSAKLKSVSLSSLREVRICCFTLKWANLAIIGRFLFG